MTRAVLCAAILASLAHVAEARPTIVVDESLPFTADELADAVQIRVHDTKAPIHVTRDGDDLVITVGDQARIVQVDPASNPHDLARVIALVIVALDASPPPTTFESIPMVAPVPPVPPVPPAPPAISESPGAVRSDISSPRTVLFRFGNEMQVPPPKDWTLRASLGMRAGDGYETATGAMTLSRRVGPSAHVVAGVSWDRNNQLSSIQAGYQMPLGIFARAGIELRHRWIALEGGVMLTRLSVCSHTSTPAGPYVSSRVYVLPIGSIQNRLYIDVGVTHISVATPAECVTDPATLEPLMNLIGSEVSVHGTLGIEVPL